MQHHGYALNRAVLVHLPNIQIYLDPVQAAAQIGTEQELAPEIELLALMMSLAGTGLAITGLLAQNADIESL